MGGLPSVRNLCGNQQCQKRNAYGLRRGGNLSERKQLFCRTQRTAEIRLEKLGGIPQQSADISSKIMLFDFLPVILQFWDADAEFDAVLKIMWDTHILDYMHFETAFFAIKHLLSRLIEESREDFL